MNLYQLEYIVSVDRHRHFARAAEACHVTQPTLSAMIHKLEEELDITIFDRSRTPVVPTEEGKAVIEQARQVLAEAGSIREIAAESHGEIRGELNLGIIPTVAPFLLPLCLQDLLDTHPGLKLNIRELTTENIVQSLMSGQLDAGIMATPLQQENLKETPLYREEFLVYSSEEIIKGNEGKITPESLDPEQLWLLEEGHCWRKQVVNFCKLSGDSNRHAKLHYQAGSIDALKRLTDAASGITLLPELATLNFTDWERQRLYEFRSPVPARQISLVTYRDVFKKRLTEAVREMVTRKVDAIVGQRKNVEVVGI